MTKNNDHKLHFPNHQILTRQYVLKLAKNKNSNKSNNKKFILEDKEDNKL